MLSKGIKYCHNYKTPIVPHESLPEPKRRNGKRTKIASKYEPFDDEEVVEEEDPVKLKKRVHKRKLKKKESEGVKLEESESAGNQDDNGSSGK